VLTRTYIHIPGIDEKIERELWLQGAEDWYALVENPRRWRISEPYLSAVLQGAATSIDALEEGDHAYFATRLPVKEHWRAYEEFRLNAAYLDIETDGASQITVIGVYDGEEVHQFVLGDDLDEFPDFIAEFSMLVTFNGLNFDVPMLYRNFPKLALDQLHSGLMSDAASAGAARRAETHRAATGTTARPRLGRAERARGGATLASIPTGARDRAGDAAALQPRGHREPQAAGRTGVQTPARTHHRAAPDTLTGTSTVRNS
jgi:uncharacterized protein YprB with RNaseH-like and TPR domain